MVIYPKYFALITSYICSAFCISKRTLRYSNNKFFFFNCAKLAFFPGTVTYIVQMLCKDKFYIKLERDIQTKDCT